MARITISLTRGRYSWWHIKYWCNRLNLKIWNILKTTLKKKIKNMFLFKPLRIILKYSFGWIVWFFQIFSVPQHCFCMPIKAHVIQKWYHPGQWGRKVVWEICLLVAIDRSNLKPSSPSDNNKDQYLHLFKIDWTRYHILLKMRVSAY